MWDKFLDLIFWIAEGVVGILPTYTPENNGMIQSLVSALAVFNQYLPFVELVQCMIAYLAFSVIYMVVKPILKFGRLS
jgi:riboflavin transporter FmnP